MFKPYSPEIRGSLEEYLKKYEGCNGDNFFYGPEYFFVIKEKGLMLPMITLIRVDQSPLPDRGYFVNSDYLLESRGPGELNMSFIGAKEGVYNPAHILKNRRWSILGLNL